MSYFRDTEEKTISEQRKHSLRAYPDFKFSDKPQQYLINTNISNIITSFRLGDAGLGNRSKHPIKICPMCKSEENTEAHLVFQCPAVKHIKDATTLQLPQGKDNANLLQQFLSCDNSSPSEMEEKAKFLEELLNYHNEMLDKSNQSLNSQEPPIFLGEKCEFCDFSSHTLRGVGVHKGRMHKNQM